MRTPLRFTEVVGAYDHPRAGRRQVFHAPPYLLTRCRIETRCRLVEEHETGRMQQRRGELKPTRPASGEESGGAAGPPNEAELADRRLGNRAGISQPVNRGAEAEVFEYRELGIERQALRHVTHPLADCCSLAL